MPHRSNELPAGDAADMLVRAERARLASVLHDAALQPLLAAAQDLTDAARGDRAAIEFAQTALAEGIEEIRRMLSEFGAPIGAPDGVGFSQESLVLFISDAARRGRFATFIRISSLAELRHAGLISLLVRELVGNAAKHARAQRVWITLDADPDSARLSVEDDGVGMPANRHGALQGHLGLALATQRTEQAGGILTITDRDGGGTAILVEVPNSPQASGPS